MYRRYEQSEQNKRQAEPPRANSSRHSNAPRAGSRRTEPSNYQRRDNRHAEQHRNSEHNHRCDSHHSDSRGNRHRHNEHNHRDNHNNDRSFEHNRHAHSRHNEHEHHNHRHNECHEQQLPPKSGKNPLLGFIPTSIYNPETGKILGFLSAEDLLLVAMILMFLDSEEEGDNLMVYALLYVLASEWIDIDFMKFLK